MIDYVNITFGGYSQASDSHSWYGPLNAFDGQLDSFWQSSLPCTPSNNCWLSYHWDTNRFKVSQYSISIGNSQSPISWILQSSEDGNVWIDLDHRNIIPDNHVRELVYTISTNEYYQYFRILFLDSSNETLPLKIYGIEFRSILQDITTTTTISTTSTISTTTTVTSTISTTRTTTSSTRSTSTTHTTVTSTTTDDPLLLWKSQTKLNVVRDLFNDWYKNGIPVGIQKFIVLPIYSISYLSIPVYVISEDAYYLGTQNGWVQLNLGNIKHAWHHATTGDDELIHVGLDTPDNPFPGKVWINTEYQITTASTTSTLSTTTTSTTTTTLSTTSTITYTYTTTTLTTTTTTTTATTTITAANYTYNVLQGSVVSSDTYALGNEPNKAIDNLDWTEWISNLPSTQGAFPHWIKFVLSEPKSCYIINVLWDYNRYADYWILEGSNDGLIWNNLYTKTKDYPPIASVWNQYLFTNYYSYSQYRVRCISGNDVITNSVGLFGIQLLADAFTTTSTTRSSTLTTLTTTSTISHTTVTTTQSLGYANVALLSDIVAIDEYVDYAVSNLVDNNENSYWICDPNLGPPYWVMFYWSNVGTSYVVNQYKLYLSTLGRPRDWQLQGSVNGIIWTTLDSESGVETEGWWEKTLTNVNSYSYYRLYITKTQSTGYAVRLGCVELWINEQYRTTTTTTTVTTTVTTLTTDTSTTQTTISTTASSTTQVIPTELSLLLNFNYPNLSTQETDDSNRQHNIAWLGNAIIKDDDSKYGIGSLDLPYPSYYPILVIDPSYVILPNSHDWVLGKGNSNFTLDFWVKLNSNTNLFRNWNNFITYFEDINNYWSIRLYPVGNLLNFIYRINGTLVLNYTVLVNNNFQNWSHVALIRLGNLFRFFVNGQSFDQGQSSNVTFEYLDADLWIGYGPSEYLNTNLNYTQANCRLDAVRISTGALWNSQFQLPPEPTTSTTISTSTVTTSTTSPFQYSPRLILRCDDGSNYLSDYSGNHNSISIINTGMSFANSFATSNTNSISPLFNQYLFSTFYSPYDTTNNISSFMTLPQSSDWTLGNGLGDFTIEGWVCHRKNVYNVGTPFLSNYQDSNNYWVIYIDYTNNMFYFKVKQNGTFIINYSSSIQYKSERWNYFALLRWNETIRVFWHGQINNFWVSFLNVTIPQFNGPLYIFGGPSIVNPTEIVSGGLVSNGIRICRGIFPGTAQGDVPIVPF